MADKQIGKLQLLLQIPQQIDDLGLDGYVQSRYRLVADDDLGFDHQCPGDADTLALSTGECMGIPHQVHGIQSYLLGHGLSLLVHLGL